MEVGPAAIKVKRLRADLGLFDAYLRGTDEVCDPHHHHLHALASPICSVGFGAAAEHHVHCDAIDAGKFRAGGSKNLNKRLVRGRSQSAAAFSGE